MVDDKKNKYKELMEGVKNYTFNPELVGATPVVGVLRKSKDPSKCVLVLSSDNNGDEVLEINLKDIVKHEILKEDEKKGDKTVRLYLQADSIIRRVFEGGVSDVIVRVDIGPNFPSSYLNLLFLISSARNEGDCCSITGLERAVERDYERRFITMNQRRILDQMLDDFRNACRGFDYRRCGFDPDNLIPKELEDEKPKRGFP